MKRLLYFALLALGVLAVVFFAGPLLRQVTAPERTAPERAAPQPAAPQVKETAAPPTSAPPTNAPILSPTEASASSEILLYQRGLNPVRLFGVDTVTGEKVLDIPGGYLSPDHQNIIAVEHTGKHTVVERMDLEGNPLATQTLDGYFYYGRTSPDGRWLAMDPSSGYDSATANKETTSRIAVVDTWAQNPARTVDLDGFFRVDGINNSGNYLYLTESLLGANEGRYWVRFYDLGAGALREAPVVEKGEEGNPSAMAGYPLDYVFSPDGEWQYTLYAFGAEGYPFIHALNLNGPFALCLDLPGSSGNDELDLAYALTLSPTGEMMFAVNTELGSVTSIRLDDLNIRSGSLQPPSASLTERLAAWLVPSAQAKVLLSGGAVLSPDGSALFAGGAHGVWKIDTQTLEAMAVLRPGTEALSLAIDPGGAHLFRADWNGIESVNLLTGESRMLVHEPNEFVRLRGVVKRN